LKIQDFNERLKDSILIADGAMGSLLHETVGTQRCFDELNTTEPEAVFRYCMGRFSHAVALSHDYPLYEFTVLVRL
jgi:methionine synthase I (cobalamin-dependent)